MEKPEGGIERDINKLDLIQLFAKSQGVIEGFELLGNCFTKVTKK